MFIDMCIFLLVPMRAWKRDRQNQVWPPRPMNCDSDKTSNKEFAGHEIFQICNLLCNLVCVKQFES